MDNQIYIGDVLEVAKVLESGNYKRYNYFIVTTGTHPCAYVQLDEEKDEELIEELEVSIKVHGGITWCGHFDDNRFGDSVPFVIGWDYAHMNDLFYLEKANSLPSYGDIAYSIDEIREDVYSVIKQIIEIKIANMSDATNIKIK